MTSVADSVVADFRVDSHEETDLIAVLPRFCEELLLEVHDDDRRGH